MSRPIDACVDSEIGELEAVILHSPGSEIENMTPENAERALYSDILNKSVALKEYQQFIGVLQTVTKCYQVLDLLHTALTQKTVRQQLIERVCSHEHLPQIKEELLNYSASELASALIEGHKVTRNTLTSYLQQERFALRPLHNFFFTRDAATTINSAVLLNKMANRVREREAWIMDTIFKHSTEINAPTLNSLSTLDNNKQTTMEGGDILIARNDTLVIGLGERTNSEGIDCIIKKVGRRGINHIIVQELPLSPESFIHLDMVFTFLDKNKCLIYAPVILYSNHLKTIHIQLEGGNVKQIKNCENLLTSLASIGIELEPIYCGGKTDTWVQEREQWHSGANFFALGPGKLIGYGRNEYTIDELSKHGFEIVKATDVIQKRTQLNTIEKYVVTIEGAELARGGGGARCMTMPLRRNPLIW